MAKFQLELPTEELNEIKRLYDNADEIFGKMTKAGAEVVLNNIKANVPASFKGSNIMKCLKITKSYKTPTNGGINTKVGFFGYFENKQGNRVPAPIVANVFEYGRSDFTKRPFLRKSFRKAEIEQAMLEEQKRASGGLLDD